VGFTDRLRAWLKGESKQRRSRPSTEAASREASGELERFAASRRGVEAFLEPKTTLYSTTVLLIADDGEYLRRPVKDRVHAASLCKDLNIPLYDARKVGYPQRMRDYDQGKRPRRVDLDDLPPWPGDEPAGPAPEGPPPPPADAVGEVPASETGPSDADGPDRPAGDEGTDGDGGADRPADGGPPDRPDADDGPR